MTHPFDLQTRVEPTAPQRYEAHLDRGFWILAGPNGGYLAAVLLRALGLAVNDQERTPRSLTVHYTARAEEGPARIETRVERRGGALTTVSGRMLQGDRLIALALAAFSRAREGFDFQELRMPEVPPPARCERRFAPEIPMHRQYEMRWALGAAPFSGGREARCGGWIRLARPRPVDALAVAAYADSFPPAVFSRVPDRRLQGGVPTVDLTVHFRAPLPLPDAGPEDFSLVLFRSGLSRGGFLEEDGEIWSPGGVLLAQSRQLALTR